MRLRKRRDYSAENQASLIKNNVPQKQWVAAGKTPCDVCIANAAQGPIASTDRFSSGDLHDPAHDGCQCYVNGMTDDLSAMNQDQISSLITWDKKA
jgi:hypothetical protein